MEWSIISRPLGRIVLLDEATSALDTHTEHQIQNALDVMSKVLSTFFMASSASESFESDICVCDCLCMLHSDHADPRTQTFYDHQSRDHLRAGVCDVGLRSVCDCFWLISQGRTTLIIAHRLSTIINSDVICVLKVCKSHVTSHRSCREMESDIT